jgi:hypothetical protein
VPSKSKIIAFTLNFGLNIDIILSQIGFAAAACLAKLLITFGLGTPRQPPPSVFRKEPILFRD